MVYCATWNVAGRSPLGFVPTWLSPSLLETPPDIYAIGFQEVFEYTSEKRSEWEEIAKASLSSLFPRTYTKVKSIRMLGIVLILFAKEPVLRQVSGVDARFVATGVMNKMKNKGAVAIRLDICKTSFCFVNCHLAHGKASYERRNQDFQEICSRMILMQRLMIDDHERVFWFGDLNYRINTTLGQNTLKVLLSQERRDELLALDQLIEQQREAKAFVGYNEGTITFEPTYKYDIGTSEFDTGSDRRPPAWTDRILWKGNCIEQFRYQSHPNFKVSDHKPVSAIFKAGVKFINDEKKHKILNDLFINFTNLEYKQLPRVRVSSDDPLQYNILHFDVVKFNEPVSKHITIENISDVPVKFRFKRKISQLNSTSKPWLSVVPLNGIIMPREKCHLDIQIYVTEQTAREVTFSGDTKLSDVLMMRIPNLRDYFLTVTGEYEKSSFGSKINALCQMKQPFRSLPIDDILRLEGSLKKDEDDKENDLQATLDLKGIELNENDKEAINDNDGEVANEPLEIPKEVRNLCRLLQEKNCFQVKGLFQTSGSNKDFIILREWLDTSETEIDPCLSVHSVADALLMFLNSLCEPIIPYEFFDRCLENSSDFNATQKILPLLPVFHKNVFNYLRQFLHQVLRHSQARNYDEQILAEIFGDIVLREKGCVECKVTGKNGCGMHGTSILARTKQSMMKNQKTSFMYQFLRNK